MVIAHEFDYRRPASLEEAIGVLSDCPGSVQILAGGTDLVAWLRDDAVAPDVLVDIKEVPGLGGISVEDDTMSIGSLVTFTELIESDLVNEHAPLLVEMAETVGSTGIRNRATMVGNICSAVPSCDAGPVLMVYNTTVQVAGPNGERSIDINDWFLGLRETALCNDEVVTRIDVGLRRHGGVYVKLMRYAGEDLAQAAVSVGVYPDHEYKVAFGAVAPTPFRSTRIEDTLRGEPLGEALVAEVVAMVDDEISPITDMRASAEYRLRMTEVMLERGLWEAAARFAGTGTAYGVRLI